MFAILRNVSIGHTCAVQVCMCACVVHRCECVCMDPPSAAPHLMPPYPTRSHSRSWSTLAPTLLLLLTLMVPSPMRLLMWMLHVYGVPLCLARSTSVAVAGNLIRNGDMRGYHSMARMYTSLLAAPSTRETGRE